jgi:hypothetical protein
VNRMAGDELRSELMARAAAVSGRSGEIFLVDGELVSLQEVIRGYEMGDHIVDAGPDKLFWASNIQATPTLQPKPVEHGLGLLSKYGPSKLSAEEIGSRRAAEEGRMLQLLNSDTAGAVRAAGAAGLLSRDSRDYRTPDGMMRSGMLPLGMTIDAAIRKGLWS